MLTRLSQARGALRDWYIVAPLAYMVMPSPLPPRRGLYDTALGRREVTLRLRNGYRLRCRLNEFDGILSAFMRREYDIPGWRWDRVRSVIDVGANVGAATLWFASHAPAAVILAIEPSPDVVPRLAANILRNRLSDRVQTMGCALGGRTGNVFLRIAPSSVGNRVSSRPGRYRAEVAQKTLKEVMDTAGFARVDVLKLDCEGAEYSVVLLAPDDVLDRVGAIIGEYHPVEGHSPDELVDRLRKVGFGVTTRGRANGQGIFVASRPGPRDERSPRALPAGQANNI